MFAWWSRRSPRELWAERLTEAKTYEEYEDAALHLDAVLGNDLWWGWHDASVEHD